VTLNTSIRGTVAGILVDLGDRVEAGQVIAQLDPREPALLVEQADAGVGAARDGLLRARAQTEVARAQLQQLRDSRRALEANINRATAALEETRTNLERMRTLVQESLVAQRELDVARTQYEVTRAAHETAQVEMNQYPSRVRVAEAEIDSAGSAVRVAEADLRRREAELALARKKLADASITAPIRGAIARRHINPGQFVVEDTPVFTIVQTDPLKFTGTVAEHAALDLRPGQLVRLRAELATTREFTGRVTRVSPAVEVDSRTVLMEAEVPNPEGRLKPGLFARGAVVVREDRDVTFVPEAAVSYFAGLTRVFVVGGGTAQQRPVTVGTRMDGLIEIVTGVRPGEHVATSRLAQLQDGAAVTTAAPAAPPGRRPGSG
jgi:RND family efflux transporter MFP subunit